MKTHFKTLPMVCLGAALLLSAAALPLRAQTTNDSSSNTTTTDSSSTMNNAPGAATNTTTTTSSSQSSTVTSGKTIYLGVKYKGTPSSLTAHANGKVYDENDKLVGHITDMDGKNLKQVPASGDYKIETRMGTVIGSTQTSPDVDSGRTVQLMKQ